MRVNGLTTWSSGLLVLALGCGPVAGADEAPVDREAVARRAVVSRGNVTRLQRVLAKSRRGESVTVAVIGGSITAGAKATRAELRYGAQIAEWWRRTFAPAPVVFHNAGIGATGTNYGALRAQRDLLSRQPDLVVVEYAVNDGNVPASAETMEGLLRQILAAPQQPAVVLLSMMNRSGGNAQEQHGRVATHYDLPQISFRDALWPEMQAGRLRWEEVEADEVHPNDPGHTWAAELVTTFVAEVLRDLPADAALPAPPPLPAPLISDRFEHVALFEADALQPQSNEGWRLDGTAGRDRGWLSDQPGSKILFEVEGTTILFMDWHIRGPMGRAKVQIDDLPPVTLEGWFDQTWGGYRQTRELARDLPPGKHRVRVELLPDKHAESTGHQFRVLGLAVTR